MNKLSIMEASVRKWDRIIAGKSSDGGVLDCPPCRLFYILVCTGCPIAAYTGKNRRVLDDSQHFACHFHNDPIGVTVRHATCQ